MLEEYFYTANQIKNGFKTTQKERFSKKASLLKICVVRNIEVYCAI